jgi:biotin-(acetyl-CoA carboxylase) ligase
VAERRPPRRRQGSGRARRLPPGAATLGRSPHELEAALAQLLAALERRLSEPPAATLDALRARDALLGAPVAWAGGEGTGAGIDGDGALRVRLPAGGETVLSAGEVHLLR